MTQPQPDRTVDPPPVNVPGADTIVDLAITFSKVIAFGIVAYLVIRFLNALWKNRLTFGILCALGGVAFVIVVLRR